MPSPSFKGGARCAPSGETMAVQQPPRRALCRAGSGVIDWICASVSQPVLLTTGTRARRLPALEGEGVFYLRTRGDADALRAELRPGVHVVMVGGGFIGAELASAARSRGAEVTVLEAGPVPMAQAIGTRLSEACTRLQRAAGIDVRVNTLVEGVRQEASGPVVVTSTGDIEADLVVVGVGAVPNQEIAADSGIDVDNGILVAGYVIMRIAAIALWLRVARDDPAHRRTALTYVWVFGSAQVGWIVLIFVDPPIATAVACSVALMLVELAGPIERLRSATVGGIKHLPIRYRLAGGAS